MKRKIGLLPYNNKNNAYIQLSKSALEKAGFFVVDGRISKINHDFYTCDCVILNWYDNLPKGAFSQFISFFNKSIYIAICKIFNIKIICVFHNRKNHNSNSTFFQKKSTKFLFESADKIIILSKKSIEYLNELSTKNLKDKVRYIPHPNYIGVYGKEQNQTINDNKMHVLFFGVVSPYKNISLILKIADDYKNDDVIFHIVGRPTSEEYKNKLISDGKELSNVIMDLRFIEDDEIANIISNSNVMIMPYDQSSLNSGTAILSFSYGRTIICPDIATLHDFDMELFYSYSYNDDSSHYESLTRSFSKAYLDFKKDKTILTNKGRKLKEMVEKYNSIELISKEYKKLISEL